MNDVITETEAQEKTDYGSRVGVDPVVINRDDFEEMIGTYKLPTTSPFIYAKYKGRWVEVVAERRLSGVMYFFFPGMSNALMSECITGICLPVNRAEIAGL